MTTKEDDFIEDVFLASTHTPLLVFTSLGRVYKMMAHEVPAGSPTTRGRPIVNLLDFEDDERPACVLPLSEHEETDFIVMATEYGTVKRTRLDAYDNIYSRGIIAIKLREGDCLIRVRLCTGDDRIIMASQSGKSIQFNVSDVSPTGRATMGVRGLRLLPDDRCVGMEVIHDPTLTILTVTRNGYGKRTPIEEYRLQGRGGKGIITIKANSRNGPVVGVRQVTDSDELVMIANSGKIIRTSVSDVSIIGRNTQGVRLMRMGDDEYVAGIALLGEEEDDEDVDAPDVSPDESEEPVPVEEPEPV